MTLSPAVYDAILESTNRKFLKSKKSLTDGGRAARENGNRGPPYRDWLSSLISEARREGREYEPASLLLERIRKEREAKEQGVRRNQQKPRKRKARSAAAT